MSKRKEELNNLTAAQLQEKIDGYRREVFQIRLTLAGGTASVQDLSRKKVMRKNVARALTYLRQLEQQ